MSGGIIFGFIRIGFYKIRFYIARKSKKLEWIAPEYLTVWESVINQAEGNEWLKVHLVDGSIYVGYIKEWSFNPDKSVQEILLGEASKVNKEMELEHEVSGQGIYLTTNSISRMEFLEGE